MEPSRETRSIDPGKVRRSKRGFGAARATARFAYRVARRLLNLEIADLVSLDLGALSRRPLEPSTFEFRFLTAEDVHTLAADPANDLDATMAERLASGRNFCFGAFDRGRLANYSWYAFGAIEREHSFGTSLALPDNTVYMHKAFTTPPYRGRRLHAATLQRAAREFVRRDVRRLVAIIEFANWPSLRSHERIGCRRIGRYWLLRGRPIASPTGAGFADFASPRAFARG